MKDKRENKQLQNETVTRKQCHDSIDSQQKDFSQPISNTARVRVRKREN